MSRQSFNLVLSGVAEITPKVADSLYEATHGDIEFSIRDGVALLEFDRSAVSASFEWSRTPPTSSPRSTPTYWVRTAPAAQV
jgi:hypothetical protein